MKIYYKLYCKIREVIDVIITCVSAADFSLRITIALDFTSFVDHSYGKSTLISSYLAIDRQAARQTPTKILKMSARIACTKTICRISPTVQQKMEYVANFVECPMLSWRPSPTQTTSFPFRSSKTFLWYLRQNITMVGISICLWW